MNNNLGHIELLDTLKIHISI